MPVKVLWLEANEVPARFALLGHIRVFRVISYDGTFTDLTSGADAAKLAYQLQDEENQGLGRASDTIENLRGLRTKKKPSAGLGLDSAGVALNALNTVP